MVVLTDSNGQTLCFMSDFTVSGSASSTATYWTVQDPSARSWVSSFRRPKRRWLRQSRVKLRL